MKTFYILNTYTNKIRQSVSESDLQELCHDLRLDGVEFEVLTEAERDILLADNDLISVDEFVKDLGL